MTTHNPLARHANTNSPTITPCNSSCHQSRLNMAHRKDDDPDDFRRDVMKGIDTLKIFLGAQSPGPIQDADRLVQLLSSCWHEFDGSSETKMRSRKLCGRVEEPQWHPPILSFCIERHGATVMGSKRASLYEWSVNLENHTASIVGKRKRQLRPNAKPLDVKAIAKTLADAVISGRADERLTILNDGRVKIEIGRAIPETNARTTAARRKRFRRELSALLEPHDWDEVRTNVYVHLRGNSSTSVYGHR